MAMCPIIRSSRRTDMGASVRASLLMRGFAKESGAAREAARRLEPYYREMVQRAHAGDVGLRRRLD
jgi:hypothetical protein